MLKNCYSRLFVLALFVISGAAITGPKRCLSATPVEVGTTSTEWRDDVKNLDVVVKLNEAYKRMPFSWEVDGVDDKCPVSLQWEVGPNVPTPWKGGVAGVIGEQVILAGGLWMPERTNLCFAYNIRAKTYEELPPPPITHQYTQGACDGKALYIVGGRAAGSRVLKLSRGDDQKWRWEDLAPLPKVEGEGRWLGTASVDPGKWLYLVSGHPTSTPAEVRLKGTLPDYRLRLDKPGSQWEKMAPYPGGPRHLVTSAVVGGKLYVFGGAHPEPVMRKLDDELAKSYGLGHAVPYHGVPNYRDVYKYDPDSDHWQEVRSTPFPVDAGQALPINDHLILLMGTANVPTLRVGKSKGGSQWKGYGDRILCYDVNQDRYSHVGVMVYGVATCPWVTDGKCVYGFGGEPAHNFNENTENVLQIGTIQFQK